MVIPQWGKWTSACVDCRGAKLMLMSSRGPDLYWRPSGRYHQLVEGGHRHHAAATRVRTGDPRPRLVAYWKSSPKLYFVTYGYSEIGCICCVLRRIFPCRNDSHNYKLDQKHADQTYLLLCGLSFREQEAERHAGCGYLRSSRLCFG